MTTDRTQSPTTAGESQPRHRTLTSDPGDGIGGSSTRERCEPRDDDDRRPGLKICTADRVTGARTRRPGGGARRDGFADALHDPQSLKSRLFSENWFRWFRTP